MTKANRLVVSIIITWTIFYIQAPMTGSRTITLWKIAPQP